MNILKSVIKEMLNEEFKTQESNQDTLCDHQGKIKIAILQRGWVFVGRFYQEGVQCWLDEAACIRNWGTTRGLGEIAEHGPTSATKLESTPKVRFHEGGIVCLIDCVESKWKDKLKN